MAGENGGSPTTIRRNAILVAVISAIIGGAGGPFILVKLGANPFRSDPFTGADAALLDQRIGQLENNVEVHLGNHPDVANKFDSRITALEAKLGVIISNQERILDRLDK